MSLRPVPEQQKLPEAASVGAPTIDAPADGVNALSMKFKSADIGIRSAVPSPYNDRAHLEPSPEYEDHDGGPWNDTPKMRPTFKSVPLKWVVAPALGAMSPAICVCALAV